ncbi:hypothetical protein PSACC_03241 [Paramicrosporidium saccamoebae]|uniref:Uncharacterized protein n=1 Tax=Paramicrosporidium saccamoebae TaxID=1246581 RepID=A0A2H9TGP0_9FUNG|nr:hypothetical protein PSACC_03241 [Paramicrosporidium saccamoebae]
MKRAHGEDGANEDGVGEASVNERFVKRAGGSEEYDSELDDLDLNTVRANERKNKVKDEFSEASDDELRSDVFKKESKPLNDDLKSWTKLEVNDASLAGEVVIEPFHMDEEMEEGKFDEESGAYIRRKDEGSHEDSWLRGITDDEIQKARIAHEARERIASPMQRDHAELIKGIIGFLEVAETPTEALQRRATKPRRFDAKSKRVMTQQTVEEKSIEEHKRKEVELITELAAALMDSGVLNIYELSREEIQRLANNK